MNKYLFETQTTPWHPTESVQEAIAEIRRVVGIPVIANGGIESRRKGGRVVQVVSEDGELVGHIILKVRPYVT